MRIDLLRVNRLRCFDGVELRPGSRLNWLCGPNGSGKTSLLEAIFVLSHGRSFRAGERDALIQRGSDEMAIFAELLQGERHLYRLGATRARGTWRSSVDGAVSATMLPLFEHCAAVCFEPGSNALLSGAADGRRRFLNWGVFHVEHASVEWWARYRRALRQRNALLRRGAAGEQFAFWEAELGRAGRDIEQCRRNYFLAWSGFLAATTRTLLPELGELRLQYKPGWDAERPLEEVLAAARQGDAEAGFTRFGAHRCDWRVGFERAPGRDFMSRGQIKAAALSAVLAQAALFAEQKGEWPILCFDDLASELDEPHQRLVAEWVAERPVQAFVAATRVPESAPEGSEVFHVERSSVSRKPLRRGV